MKANLKQGVWLLTATLLSLTTMAQGRHDRDRRDYDDDWYEDRYPYDRNDRKGHSEYHRMVRQRPAEPYCKMPRRPGSRHIWIPGEYRWHRGGYVYVPGYWMLPPRKNMQYVPGYWQPTRGGYVWISGFWQDGNMGMAWKY